MSAELIGAVAAAYLRERLDSDEGNGTARFIIDSLSSDHIAAIAHAILSDPYLCTRVEMKLPAHALQAYGLPPNTLAVERATYYRNASCDKPALLLASIGDDEAQSLRELVPIGVPLFQDRPDLWVQVAATGLELPEDHTKWWERALRGLFDVQVFPLARIADFIVDTRCAIQEEGLPLIHALGYALPVLHVPRDPTYFVALSERVRTQPSRWKTLFSSAYNKRACYLRKQTPSQSLLTEADLAGAFDRVQNSIPDQFHKVIREFITAPGNWNPAARALAECDWESIKPLFDGLQREKYNLGKATSEFFDDREPELLTGEERDYLHRLAARRSTEANEEDRDFYEHHRHECKDDPKLSWAWDRFVFRAPRESDDFLAGIVLCLESLFRENLPSTRRVLTIICDRSTKKDLKGLNVDAGRYFARRYRGIRALLGQGIQWQVGELFRFDEVVETWQASHTPLNHSTARAALQLRFRLILEIETIRGELQPYHAQLIWTYNPNAAVTEFVADWDRLVAHPLVYCRVMRKAMGAKGFAQALDLENVRSLMPVYGQDSGSFVAAHKTSNDISQAWRRNLKQAVESSLITPQNAQDLLSAFEAFEVAYSLALGGFKEQGIVSPDLQTQAQAYAELLEWVYSMAKGDRNRELLLRPLLSIGVVAVDGGSEASIVAPWHPLRLSAVGRKSRLVATLVKSLLAAQQVQFGDGRLFFRDFVQTLAHPFYPEVVAGWRGSKPTLLGLSDVSGDYSLHEPPVAEDSGSDDVNDNPTLAASTLLELVRRFLALYSHKRANLSLVLYNCDAARLPQAVVEKVASLYEDDDDVRCQVILRHREAQRLRTLYERIIESVEGDVDTLNASETTQDFMARLRIAIMADQAPPPNPKDGCFADIVFCQDVIARHARLEWYLEDAKPADGATLLPAHWSRRRPVARGDMKSVVYLCSPVNDEGGWSYLTALATFFQGDWDGTSSRRWLPARQLDFQEPSMVAILNETHDLGTWVVNYDELLDRRQLLEQHVRIIRYKHISTQGRNIVISSTAPLDLLRQMVVGRLQDLDLELGDGEYERLADRFIADANDISGDIALRAAQHGRYASELMGVVLSRYLVQQELGMHQLHGWYFLDDYAEWLGQHEEQIADILVLSPSFTESGGLRLDMVVTEAKYIDASSLTAKRKESQKQLRDTVTRIEEALFGAPERLDRSLWLARLSDLILDGVRIPAGITMDLAQWRRAIRDGNCEIFLRGYSHVFVSGPSDGGTLSDYVEVAGVDDAYQEVYSTSDVRRLVLLYHRSEDPSLLRNEIGGNGLWASRAYRPPSKVHIASYCSKSESENGDNREPSSLPPDRSTEVAATVPASSGENAASHPDEGDLAPAWAYPTIQPLLAASTSFDTDETQAREWLKQIEVRTRTALQQYQLRSKLLSSTLTPNAALLRFMGGDDLTIEQVNKRQTQFLTTYGLNIIAVQPEPGAIALSVERPQRQVVRLEDVWKRWSPDSSNGNQDLLIGVREDNGGLLILSPGTQHAPHTLIAGSTGSGKSVLLQDIILAIVATNTPQQARLIVIDPKQGVDYFQFDGLPHLEGNSVIDQQDVALERLRALVDEMDARYTKFKAARASNLQIYNRRAPTAEKLPVLWLIHDEFAEWMMVDSYKQEVTSLVSRLGVKARAAGIYLIFAAQRPDANVMPMQLRANLGNRLILRVDSEGTSELALGEKGAERLLGRGHILAKLEGQPLCYAQVPLVSEQFMEKVVAIVQRSQ